MTTTARPRLHRAMIFASTIWVLIALVRLTAWLAGHPGDRASLAFSLVGGAAGAVALAAHLLPKRGQRP